jgi:hypothetical protein
VPGRVSDRGLGDTCGVRSLVSLSQARRLDPSMRRRGMHGIDARSQCGGLVSRMRACPSRRLVDSHCRMPNQTRNRVRRCHLPRLCERPHSALHVGIEAIVTVISELVMIPIHLEGLQRCLAHGRKCLSRPQAYERTKMPLLYCLRKTTRFKIDHKEPQQAGSDYISFGTTRPNGRVGDTFQALYHLCLSGQE